MKQGLLKRMKRIYSLFQASLLLLLLVFGVSSASATDYKLVTSADQLVAGAKYIIADATSGKDINVISTESNTNNRRTVKGDVSNGIISASENMMVFELGGTTDAWTFTTVNYGGTNGDLYNDDTSNNRLKVGSDTKTNAFTITFANNAISSIKCNGNTSKGVMCFNGTLVACYSSKSSSYKVPQLYKEVAGGGSSTEKTLSSIAVTTQPTKTEYTVGDALDLTGCVVTATYSNNTTANVTSSCTFSPANGAKLETAGTQTVTVSYESKTTSFNVIVKAATTPGGGEDGIAPTGTTLWAESFESTKNVGSDVELSKYDYSGRSGYSGNATSVTYSVSDATNARWSNSSSTGISGCNLWLKKQTQAEFVTSAINLYGAKKVSFEFTKSKSKLIVSWSVDNTKWTQIYSDASATAVAEASPIEITIPSGATSIYIKLKEGNNSNNCRVDNLALKVVKDANSTDAEPQNITLSFSQTEVTATLGEEFVAPTLTNESGVEVVYSSSNPQVATVNKATGAVSLVGAGTTTIKAAFDGNDTYNAAEASYTLVVENRTPSGEVVKGAIVAEMKGKWYAATSELNSNKLKAVEVQIINGKVYYTGDAAIEWTYADGTFATAEGKYLAQTGTGTNVALSTTGNIYWSEDAVGGFLNNNTKTRALFYNGTAFGNYALTNLGGSNYSGAAQLLPIMTAEEIEVAKAATIKITSVGYATYSPVYSNVTIPANVEVYVVKTAPTGEYVDIVKYEGATLKQGEGVILKGNAGNYSFTETTAEATPIEGNILVGASSDIALKANSSYLLANEGGKAVFSLCNAGTLSAGKAYLPANGANAPSLSIVIDDATAIEGLTTSQPHNLTTSTYNLAGQKVGADYKGIVIVNGKKLIKK